MSIRALARRVVGLSRTSCDFDRWWKTARLESPDLLSYTKELLIQPGSGHVSTADFPDVWRQGTLALDLVYELDPLSPSDGVTVEIPLAVLDRVAPAGFDWNAEDAHSAVYDAEQTARLFCRIANAWPSPLPG